MNGFKTIPPLLWRGMVFLACLMLISGFAGQRIIAGGILFRDGFSVYSDVGKVALFGIIVFFILAYRKKLNRSLHPWHPLLLCWLGLSVVAFWGMWLSVDILLTGERTATVLLMAHAGLVTSVLGAALGSLGPGNMRLLYRLYARELGCALLLAVLFLGFLQLVYALWEPLASVVLLAVKSLVELTGLNAVVLAPHTLVFDKFSITIAQYCSGIESIALFTGFYALAGLLDWERFNKRRYISVFPFALAALFACNILRVSGLVLVGYYVNKELAFGLFHTYAGTMFFIACSGVFWFYAYGFMCEKVVPGRERED